MELDFRYLKALIQDCDAPAEIVSKSRLRDICSDDQTARETLLNSLSVSGELTPMRDPSLLTALRYLGVDVPEGERVIIRSTNPHR